MALLCFGLIGCSKLSGAKGKGSLSSSSSASAGDVVLVQSAFQKSVYPYVTTAGCANCHSTGPTNSIDWFAQSDVASAFASAITKVNVKNPSQSLFAIRISDNHCGFPSICQVSNTTMLSKISDWIQLSATAGPGGATPCVFNGQTLQSGTTTAAYSTATVPYGVVCDTVKVNVSCVNGTLTPSTAVAACTTAPGATCSFNGQTLATGDMVKAYQTASVPFGSTCASEQRTCTNGTLSGSFTFAACAPNPPLNCTFNNMTISSGTSTMGFPTATVPFGQTCQAAPITCTNGVLNPANYVAACAPLPGASCTFNGQSVASGSTVKAFQTGSVPFGSTCTSETRTCTNGVLSGSYGFASCAVGAAATCSFNGQSIASGGTTTGFPSATVPFGQTCQSSTITCNNGVLNPANYVPACSVAPGASCTFNGQSVASGSTVTAYQSATVPFGSACSSVAQTRTCTNGTLSGSYTFASCAPNPPATCTFNGQTIASGGTTSGYPSATVPFGQTCTAQTITCTNGVLSPANDVATCATAPGASCTFNGKTIASGGTTTGFASPTVPAGQTCSSITISCTNGVLNPASASPSCAPAASTFGSSFVPANESILIRLNVGLNLPGKKDFYCKNASNCGQMWTLAQPNVSMRSNPNLSSGANQVSLLAFSGCNDISPGDWGVNTANSVATETNNLINAGVKMVDNHTAGLGTNSTYNAQVKAAFQALISDPAYAGASTQKVFVGICTAATTFGIGMKGY